MKSAVRKLGFVTILTSSSLCVQAQTSDSLVKENQFTLSGQIKARGEYRDGTFQPLQVGVKPAALISQRTRLNFEYSYKDLLTVKIAPQFVSVWGQENLTQGIGSNNGLALFETWAKLKVTKSSHFVLGRQIISLDDERFFGELDWAQGGRAHDALSFQIKRSKFEGRAYVAYNQNYKSFYSNNISNPSGNLYSPKDAVTYKWMQTIWVRFQLNEQNKLSLLATNLGFQNATNSNDTVRNYNSQTYGAHYELNKGKSYLALSAYFQGGKNQIGTKTLAYLGSVAYSYSIHEKFKLGAGSDWVSGNKVGGTSTTNFAFTPYFGTNHKFYGSMDYFYAGNGHKGAGLWDNYVKLTYKPHKKWQLALTGHQFHAPFGIINGTDRLSEDLGQEIDFDIAFTINKFVKLTGGYSIYLVNNSIRYLKNITRSERDQHFGWISLNITPTFFQLKQ